MSIQLRKQAVQIVLEKKNLQHVQARVALVIDASGSMRKLYKEGVVQDAVERILAVASQFDDDGELDVWVYDNTFSRLPVATEQAIPNYVQREILENPAIHKFGRNDEALVMADILEKFLVEQPLTVPSFVVFINDGGCKSTIKKRLITASDKPIFWQFVGIGDGNFDFLRKLDDMTGRVVDNANFFHLVALEETSDAQLYDALLDEFPEWLREAKAARILT